MIMYLDESGDLGFTLDKPNREGGSSRFLTISHVCYPDDLDVKVIRFVKNTMKFLNYNFSIEVKGSSISDENSNLIVGKLIDFKRKHQDFKIGSIIVNKTNVNHQLRKDTNILYNYSTSVLLLPYIRNLDTLKFYPDKRSIKVNRGDSMIDYMKTKLYAEDNSNLILEYEPKDSENSHQMWLADWITNFVWRHYEDKRSVAYNRLKASNIIFERKLYFDR